MFFSRFLHPSESEAARVAAGTVDGHFPNVVPNLRLKNCPIKSKAASIKLTLAAVGFDAEELLRSCARGLVHNKRRRDAKRANLLEVVAPSLECDADWISR